MSKDRTLALTLKGKGYWLRYNADKRTLAWVDPSTRLVMSCAVPLGHPNTWLMTRARKRLVNSIEHISKARLVPAGVTMTLIKDFMQAISNAEAKEDAKRD